MPWSLDIEPLGATRQSISAVLDPDVSDQILDGPLPCPPGPRIASGGVRAQRADSIDPECECSGGLRRCGIEAEDEEVLDSRVGLGPEDGPLPSPAPWCQHVRLGGTRSTGADRVEWWRQSARDPCPRVLGEARILLRVVQPQQHRAAPADRGLDSREASVTAASHDFRSRRRAAVRSARQCSAWCRTTASRASIRFLGKIEQIGSPHGRRR